MSRQKKRSFEVGQIWPHCYPLLHFSRNTQKKVVRLKFRDEKLIKRFHSVSSSTIIDFRAFYRKKSPLLKTSTTRKNESVALKLLDACHTGTAELREKWLRWMDTHCTKGKKRTTTNCYTFFPRHTKYGNESTSVHFYWWPGVIAAALLYMHWHHLSPQACQAQKLFSWLQIFSSKRCCSSRGLIW